MRVWLAISAVLFFAWAIVLLLSPQSLLSADHVAAHASLILLFALANAALAACACWSAPKPQLRRTGIYTTILTLLCKWVADTYGVLVVLPPQQAALILGDLILSLALVVGILEALPRTFGIETE